MVIHRPGANHFSALGKIHFQHPLIPYDVICGINGGTILLQNCLPAVLRKHEQLYSALFLKIAGGQRGA